MEILILGAAGQVAQMLRKNLLNETNHSLLLYARNAQHRIMDLDDRREKTIDGDFLDEERLNQAMKKADLVYLNDMGNTEAVKMILSLMDKNGVKRFVGTSILGIYDEVFGPFGKWNDEMIGSSKRMMAQKESAKLIEESDLDYTLLRLTWLYNQVGNESYSLTSKGQPFIGAQVTRQAVARLLTTIIQDDQSYIDKSLGVYEPGSEKLSKPSFY